MINDANGKAKTSQNHGCILDHQNFIVILTRHPSIFFVIDHELLMIVQGIDVPWRFLRSIIFFCIIVFKVLLSIEIFLFHNVIFIYANGLIIF